MRRALKKVWKYMKGPVENIKELFWLNESSETIYRLLIGFGK